MNDSEKALKENPTLTDEEKKLLEDKEAMALIQRLNANLVYTLRVSRFKSIRRAGRRNHLTPALELLPKRPFNNRANTCKRKDKHSRFIADQIRKLYENRKKHNANRETDEQSV